jgi:hypothetical protein
MKKFYTLSLLLLAVIMGFSQPFTAVWTKRAYTSDYAWFASGNDVNSLAYNPATNKLLVAKRGTAIYIINPETGAEEGTLNVTGIGGEGFKYSKIRVTSDGVIYAISLATGAGQCKINRWANQAATPTLCADFSVTERTGDSFGLSGSGSSTILYASGAGNGGGTSNNINIYMLTTFNGINFFVDSKINVATSGNVPQWANRAVEPVTNSVTSDLWIKSGGGPARRITVGPKSGDVRTGTVAFQIEDGVGNGQASVGYGGMRLLTTPNGNKFLIFAGGNNSNAGTRMKTLEVGDETAVKTFGLDSLYTGDVVAQYVTNANGTGDVSYKMEANGEYTVFYVSTNNGLQATKTGLTILPVTLAKFEASILNKTARLTWLTAAENNNRGFEIERSANGTDFAKIGFVASKATDGNSKLPLQYQFDDQNLNAGKQFYRLRQIDKDGKINLSDIRWVEKGNNSTFVASLRSNPITENLSLNINSLEKGNVQISLVNASGAVLMSAARNVESGENIVNMPANNLPKGIYFVTVRDNNNPSEPVSLKVIK